MSEPLPGPVGEPPPEPLEPGPAPVGPVDPEPIEPTPEPLSSLAPRYEAQFAPRRSPR